MKLEKLIFVLKTKSYKLYATHLNAATEMSGIPLSYFISIY